MVVDRGLEVVTGLFVRLLWLGDSIYEWQQPRDVIDSTWNRRTLRFIVVPKRTDFAITLGTDPSIHRQLYVRAFPVLVCIDDAGDNHS